MRRLVGIILIGCVGLVLGLPMPAGAIDLPFLFSTCPPDSVRVGPTCLDKYEASVWEIAPPLTVFKRLVIQKIRAGTVRLADLTTAGAVQLGLVDGDLAANGCPDTGNGCVHVYAVAIAGVAPAREITWFQAAAAARNSFKRLPPNAEWQAGALGTPDPGTAPGAEDCNTNSAGPDLTGARANCVSDTAAFDMVGNVWEWVADWVPPNGGVGTWGLFSDDTQGLAGAAIGAPPGALNRGGGFFDVTGAGVFAVTTLNPASTVSNVGFRAAR